MIHYWHAAGDVARRSVLALLLISVATGALWAQAPQQNPSATAPAAAQAQPQAAPAQGQPQPVTAPESEQQTTLHLLVGRSLVMTSPARIKRISVADPAVADAVVINPHQLLINGKAPGGVSLVLWDENDQSQTFELLVDLDVLGLAQRLREVFPNEQVKVEAAKDAVVLSGPVSSSAMAEKVLEVAKTAGPKVINLMQVPVAATGQVLLEVKFAEVDRGALTQLGVNILSTGAANTIGTTTTGQFGQFGPQRIQDVITNKASPRPDVFVPSGGSLHSGFSTSETINDVLNLFLFRPDIHLGVVIRALQQKNLLQILAEPNLLTQSGKEASFLAGGEFPFPVVQAGTGTTAVTIQFKEFGVRLNFTPTIATDGTIHLKVRPEVSSLDFTNALTISGFFVPALSTRRVESEMDLRDGQSFAIAGLVDNRLTQVSQRIPGLGDIPVLGKLFQSKSFNRSRSELLVMVTPRIVQPLPAGQQPPGPQFPKEFMPPATVEKPAGGSGRP